MENIVYKKMPTTLLLVIKDGKILLASKKRGFGIDKYNGVGGKLEPGETIEQGMIRETQEEIGIIPTNYTLRGVIRFVEYYKGNPVTEDTHIFVADSFEGEPIETDEMRPYWFDIDKIPYDKMFPDDKTWLPMIIAGKNVVGEFKFDKDFNKLGEAVFEATDDMLQEWLKKFEEN